MMNFKNLLLRYITFHSLYKKALEGNAYDKDGIVLSCKKMIVEDKSIDKKEIFYYLLQRQDFREWSSPICFSFCESMARKAYVAHQRYTTKFYLLELETKIEAEIKSITLQEILEDELLFESFVNRISYIVPFDKEKVAQISDEYIIKILWNFEHHLQAQALYFDKENFFYSNHEDASFPSSMDYGYSVVIDDDGKYGVIHNKTKLLSGKPDMEWILPCEHYYINIEGALAEVQKNPPKLSDDFREYICDIVDLESKKVYISNALCNSLEYDNCIEIDKNSLLRYIKIDTKEKKIVAKSDTYSYIVTPMHYSLKPVQDAKTKLWGYIDKSCKEIISPRYKTYQFFNDGYAIIDEDDRVFVINEAGHVIIKPDYKSIEHYEYDYFFVEDKKGRWAVFLKDKIYIDFVDLDSIKEVSSKEKDKHYTILIYFLKEKFKTLQKKKFSLPLREYISLFEPAKSEKNLIQMGLWGQKVCLKSIPQGYEEVIKKDSFCYIGWSYPSGAGMFDMSVELPVMFQKKDGSDLTLGIGFDDIEIC